MGTYLLNLKEGGVGGGEDQAHLPEQISVAGSSGFQAPM